MSWVTRRYAQSKNKCRLPKRFSGSPSHFSTIESSAPRKTEASAAENTLSGKYTSHNLPLVVNPTPLVFVSDRAFTSEQKASISTHNRHTRNRLQHWPVDDIRCTAR